MDADDFEAIFDVSPSFNTAHLPGATNARASAGGTDLSELIEGMDKTKAYLVYCHSDSPAMAGAQLMEDADLRTCIAWKAILAPGLMQVCCSVKIYF